MRELIPIDVDTNNFVLLGEAGCGKSELAINLACWFVENENRPVHLFDLDMTKPLFRTRDQAVLLTEMGIIVHFQEQTADAPTVSGGVRRLLRDESCYTILDVGGDYIGARAVGGYAPLLNGDGSAVWYVMNPYRPWTTSLERIDRVLGQTLGVSHIQLERLHLVGNPNLGAETTAEEVIVGGEQLVGMVGAYKPIDFLCAEETLAAEVERRSMLPVFPIHRYLAYPWTDGEELLLRQGAKT